MTPGPLTDRLLQQRCLAGDAAAWAELVRAFGPALLRCVRRRLGRHPAAGLRAEEVLGDVWWGLWEHAGARLRAYDPSRGPLAGYLARLAVGRIRRLLRSEERRRRREAAAARPEACVGPAEGGVEVALAEIRGLLTPAQGRRLRELVGEARESQETVTPAARRQRVRRLRLVVQKYTAAGE